MNEENSYKGREFELSSGEVIHLVPVRSILLDRHLARLRREYEAEHPEVKPPTFTIESGDPDEPYLESHEHFEDPERGVSSLDQFEGMDKVREVGKWRKYQAALGEMNAWLREQRVLSVLALGIEEQPPEDDDWADMVRALGDDVPTDPIMRKVLWLEVELGLSEGDRGLIVNDLSALAMKGALTDDDLDTFRDTVKAAVTGEARERLAQAYKSLPSVLDQSAETDRAENSESVGS